MTEQSKYLVALARRIVQPYTQLPTCKAAMVTGSAAKGLSDNYSDKNNFPACSGRIIDAPGVEAHF